MAGLFLKVFNITSYILLHSFKPLIATLISIWSEATQNVLPRGLYRHGQVRGIGFITYEFDTCASQIIEYCASGIKYSIIMMGIIASKLVSWKYIQHSPHVIISNKCWKNLCMIRFHYLDRKAITINSFKSMTYHYQ